ncbi:dihydroxyacetone kinase family protein [Cellulomonas sp. KRMCY2]|uniref:dihydroxyacetone kinase family protein n=1 Tax=Cellulomonas sp. KRMCY2 TaxID=1304865 RepID=UPI00045E8B00|nr:dihydroxyacetone kinase family protein [Cellulomonas sp. KRMCY2]
MTRLYDDPAEFMEDMLAGFLDAHRDRVTGVPGGVVRSTQTAPGKVAVVVGGGSGHYPAFCGVVGPGFADGAVVGNIFTSPSAEDAYSVGRAASGGGGVVITSGNYAGDVMNFTQAQERLTAEGIEARVVFVTDDVASAPVSDVAKRRGIAGDFVVFKAMGAAAEEGCSLDEVVRIGIKANDRTRTLGVAFAGCTMPGADHPLFTVPVGKMGVGLGIHGEPGVSEDAIQPAADLARRLVDGAIAELELGENPRVGAILNGLGATKYEELFVVWKTVSALLRERGVTIVDPEVGELVTSLDMAGCSLTLVALDDELERLWRAPADTPAYRKAAGSAVGWAAGERRHESVDDALTGGEAHAVATAASVACAARAFRALTEMQTALVEVEDELGRIDAIAGDGDHGRGMVKGIAAAVGAARPCADDGSGVATLLRSAGRAWQTKAGGTSGALWGAALIAVGDRLGDERDEIAGADVVAALRAGQDAIQRLGKCELGDKTMLDALGPFVTALERDVSAGRTLPAAWAAAAVVAERAAKDTAPMTPRVGRARPLAERSIGTPDAGATSLALCLGVAGRALAVGVTDEA